MSSCLIDVAQFVYALPLHINDSPDAFADQIFERFPVKIQTFVENMSIDSFDDSYRKMAHISTRTIFFLGVGLIS